MPKTKCIGYCGVDSGQLIVIDPCYLREWKDGEFNPDKKLDNSYARASEITLTSKDLGGETLEQGVVFATGIGDGLYPVVAHYKNIGKGDVRISKVVIDFGI